jgi:hypothetical protein
MASACGRASAQTLTYLSALVGHNPSALPVAANVKFTEDNVQKKLGEGLWQTTSKLRTFRQDVLDVRENTAASLVVLEEGSSPALFTLRLKIADQKISEIETMLVPSQAEGLGRAAPSWRAARTSKPSVSPPWRASNIANRSSTRNRESSCCG